VRTQASVMESPKKTTRPFSMGASDALSEA